MRNHLKVNELYIGKNQEYIKYEYVNHTNYSGTVNCLCLGVYDMEQEKAIYFRMNRMALLRFGFKIFIRSVVAAIFAKTQGGEK